MNIYIYMLCEYIYPSFLKLLGLVHIPSNFIFYLFLYSTVSASYMIMDVGPSTGP